MKFLTGYEEILQQAAAVDPVLYASTRNYINGGVTYLSPYISRGVIAGKQVLEHLIQQGYTSEELNVLVKELAWREYFQRVWQHLETGIFTDIRVNRTKLLHRKMPAAVVNATTGIEAIDKGIEAFYKTGYMHNHLRMYVASLCSNIGKAYWQEPSQWMYYHLLDGDLASNTLSWQWVAGSFSKKQYYFNQENVNRYTGSKQENTIVDVSYDLLPSMDVPEVLKDTATLKLETVLPAKQSISIDPSLPLLIYNSYNLDPLWRKDEKANRVLLLEPSHFREFPVSEKVIDFIISLSKNIDGIQVMVGEIKDIPHIEKIKNIYSKEHPAFKYYPGTKDEREWMFPEVDGLYNSFFAYWKRCEKFLHRNYFQHTVFAKAS